MWKCHKQNIKALDHEYIISWLVNQENMKSKEWLKRNAYPQSQMLQLRYSIILCCRYFGVYQCAIFGLILAPIYSFNCNGKWMKSFYFHGTSTQCLLGFHTQTISGWSKEYRKERFPFFFYSLLLDHKVFFFFFFFLESFNVWHSFLKW